jgi:3D (Asp-Asp-Asp) domain-containing protein
LWGRPPNHILLDFYDSNGNSPFNVAAQLNGVSAPTNTVEVSEDSKGSNAEASGVAKSTAAATGATSTGGTAARTTTSALNAAGRSVASLGSGVWVAGIVAMMVGAGGLSLSL